MSTIQHFEQLVSIMQDIPAGCIDLTNWVSPCGTKACIIGHACAHPYFMAQGLTRHDKENSCMPMFGQFNHLNAIGKFFGVNYDQTRYLFMSEAYPEGLVGQELKDEIIERLTTHVNALKLLDSVKEGAHG